MSAYLIGEDGPHTGAVISLDEGDEWILGRDPDLSFFALEDPMVSRRHLLIGKADDGSYFLSNLSSVNPVMVNGSAFEGNYPLKEDDLIQIGNSFLRFTEIDPDTNLSDEVSKESLDSFGEESLSKLPFFLENESRWLLKVIAGPNQGAEFGMNLLDTHVIGKDPSLCDIIFQDLSVSKRHAKIEIVKEDEIILEDLSSRNGTFVNGVKIDGPHLIRPQDVISLGTTSFLVIDREKAQETIYALAPAHPSKEEEITPSDLLHEVIEEEEKPEPSIKELFIPTRHLVVAAIFGLFLVVGCISFFALFRSNTVVVAKRDETKEIQEILKPFEMVQFSFNASSGKIFLMGHVLRTIDHNELIYLIKTLSFITSIEDNVVVDEGVWEEMNALLAKNPNWRGVMVTAIKPGQFVIRGYLPTPEEATKLQDYINLNFSYLNLIDNQVVVENTLQTEVQSMLIEEGFLNVGFQFNNGEFIFAGRVNLSDQKSFEHLLEHIQNIQGVRQIKNFVIFAGETTGRVDLSDKYQVTGTSKYGEMSQYALINGRILAKGDLLDGMVITAILSNEIQLDKDGLKYKIDYNQQ